ncbi:MAG: iron-sulfur cluster assembly scaffold protein [Candidatus Solibacter usitatus]|nr:iron-sulfur cluster assembly scaffold protein [Candidatus Solibacter usitatus]
MHSSRLLDHFQNPRNVGELPPPALVVEVSNPICGDILKLWVQWEADRVAQVRFKTRGCAAAIAMGSALTEWMVGKTRAELAAATAQLLEQQVGGLIPESKHAAVLANDAVRQVSRPAL